MFRDKLTILSAVTAFALVISNAACGDKDSDTGDSAGDNASAGDGDAGDGDAGDGDAGDGDAGDGDAMDCGPTHVSEGTLADGESCATNGECASGLCLSFSDVPADPDAVCIAYATDCATRVTGTLRNLVDGTPVADATVGVVGAIGAATNPTSAARIVESTTDADGRYDMTTPGGDDRPMEVIALTALAEGSDIFLSSTGLDSAGEGNLYGPGVSLHDIWAVTAADVTNFSDLLALDATFPADKLPLGAQGGVIGLLRDGATGDPVAGATIQSASGDSSTAVIRYLNDAEDAFDGTVTGTSGLFVIVAPGLGEGFEAVVNGEVVADQPAGSSAGAVFIMALTM